MTPTPLPFETDKGIGTRARLGLIVLETDRTIEPELRGLLDLEGLALYHSRIPSDPEVTSESLARMEANLPAAAKLLPAAAGLDVVGYGCTSGATIIGEDKVAQAVRRGLGAGYARIPVTNPITAVKAALRALGAVRIGFVTPYLPEVTGAMRAHLEQQGFQISRVGSFNQSEEDIVARITPASIRDAILEIGGGGGSGKDCDAVFVSCTNLRVAGVIEETEAELDKPVLSSNPALAWHMLRLAGIDDALPGRGRLFMTTIPRSPDQGLD